MKRDAAKYDVVIVGGSYAGLSAAMALGRALRHVLILDGGQPCNRQTPHSHNFITHDGEVPRVISDKARAQVLRYATVTYVDDIAVSGRVLNDEFQVETSEGEMFRTRKLLFATGLKDIMPAIEGFAECWGISVLHCPYCHGYEVKNETTGIIAQGDMGFEMVRLIAHWTKDLTLFTNGPSQLSGDQLQKIESHQIRIVETAIERIAHDHGRVKYIHLQDGKQIPLKAIYARPAVTQHCSIPQDMGCEITEQNLLKTDMFHRTSIPGVYAAGDNSSLMRSVSIAVASGGFAGASINKDLIDEDFG